MRVTMARRIDRSKANEELVGGLGERPGSLVVGGRVGELSVGGAGS